MQINNSNYDTIAINVQDIGVMCVENVLQLVFSTTSAIASKVIISFRTFYWILSVSESEREDI